MAELALRARQALACLDLTLLTEAATPADVAQLCARARSRFGDVAAVCTWPRFIAQARAALPASIKVAGVAAFPDGAPDLARALADVEQIAQAGGDEVDLVLPYRELLAGRRAEVAEFLGELRFATRPLTLKVIIESGALATAEAIAEATRIALAAGADFVKTSTGKTRVSATPEAARTMLAEIKASGMAHAGFKASGGIRTVADAAVYLELAESMLGSVAPTRLRLGASGLLDDIEALLGGTDRPQHNHAY
ncbi:MAG: deoxyribose-phosphate aldolase [Pelomonas sp.]|nr:deoxyribose-phosphate aldolase [Roseateles sp.]